MPYARVKGYDIEEIPYQTEPKDYFGNRGGTTIIRPQSVNTGWGFFYITDLLDFGRRQYEL